MEALSDLGPQLTSETEFPDVARNALVSVMEAIGGQEGAIFAFSDRPAMLTAVAAHGFALLPDPAFIPLLPKHIHALTSVRGPLHLTKQNTEAFLSANGNIAPELFKCLAPLTVNGKLVGVIALGRRPGDIAYGEEEFSALALLATYVALAVNNHSLQQSLTQRVSENLKLLASMHGFYDTALEAFATAIDVKHIDIRGHSLRVGRYSAGIADALGLEPTEVAALRSAGYLHDIGKVAVDKHLFAKPSALDPEEFRAMADHTVVGHQIVSGVQFPWPRVPEVVRWHHERADGSGYPDNLHVGDIPMPARIVALADTFDAMTSHRPYREPLSIGETLSEIVRLTPAKFDPGPVQGLLVQVRRDAVGNVNRTAFLDEHIECNIAPGDVDNLAASLQHKISNDRTYLA